MKTTILPFILCLFYSLASFSQFELTENGITVIDSENDYIVYEFEGKTKEDLYTSVLKTLTVKYNSAKDVLSKVENETISINGIQADYVGAGKLLGKYLEVYDLGYNLNISFKDAKIKIDIPTIRFPNESNGRTLHISGKGMFKTFIFKKGEVKEEDAKKRIEDFFNILITEIKQGVENKQDDW
ncbi:DUF4468 domain-containing protein [uncultured Lutibacter sp.]|uniref:DUF4468 domain-containing protein n=1 Tax=uncultured Lutibacter sp. TaxID=437739 RepID=UPI00260D5AAF|nr:DUF4468 domain-containing protein [uncultured Lutibacter sp.]